MVSVLTFADMCWLLSPPQGVVCVVTAFRQSEASLVTLHQSEAGTQPSPGPLGPGEWVQQPLDIASITHNTLSSASNRYNTLSGDG